MLTIVNKEKYMKEIEQLYDLAFPKEERYLDFKPTIKQLEKEKGEVIAFEDVGEHNIFVGFAMMLLCKNIAYIYYFAIDKKMRGKKYGEEALTLIKKRYANSDILLGVEKPDKTAKNQEERLRRKKFYYNNGFIDTEVEVEKNGFILQMMSIDGDVNLKSLWHLGVMVDDMIINGRKGEKYDG